MALCEVFSLWDFNGLQTSTAGSEVTLLCLVFSTVFYNLMFLFFHLEATACDWTINGRIPRASHWRSDHQLSHNTPEGPRPEVEFSTFVSEIVKLCVCDGFIVTVDTVRCRLFRANLHMPGKKRIKYNRKANKM